MGDLHRTPPQGREWERVVRQRGFEPPQGCPCQPLKLVRLPVPPLPRLAGAQNTERVARIHRSARARRDFQGAGFGAGASAGGTAPCSAGGAAGLPTSSKGSGFGAAASRSSIAPSSNSRSPWFTPMYASERLVSMKTI